MSAQLSSLLPFAHQTTHILILFHQYTFLLSSLVIVLPFKVFHSEKGVEQQADSLLWSFLTLKMPHSWQN